jgi:hypothetical protein
MKDVIVSASFRDFPYFEFAAPEHVFRVSYAGLYQITIHGHTGLLSEEGAEIHGIQAHGGGHLFDRKFFGIMSRYMGHYFFYAKISGRRIDTGHNQFKKTVQNEQKQSPYLDGIKGLTVQPDKNKFMKEVDKIVMYSDMICQWKWQPRLGTFQIV